MLYYSIIPTLNILWLPLLLLLALVTSLGVGLWLSAMNVRYHDVPYIVPFLTQFWLFATPIAYPSSLLQEPWRTLYGLNPMVGVVEGFRWALLGTNTAPGPMIACSAGIALALLVGGGSIFAAWKKRLPMLCRESLMGDIALRVEDLSKQYRIVSGRRGRIQPCEIL